MVWTLGWSAQCYKKCGAMTQSSGSLGVPPRRAHLIGELLKAQRMVQPFVWRLVNCDNDGGVADAKHDAAGERGAGGGGARGAQVHHVMRPEPVLWQRRGRPTCA